MRLRVLQGGRRGRPRKSTAPLYKVVAGFRQPTTHIDWDWIPLPLEDVEPPPGYLTQ